MVVSALVGARETLRNREASYPDSSSILKVEREDFLKRESFFAWRSVGHLSFEDTVDPEPEGGAPGPFSDPDDQDTPAPPTDRGVTHSNGLQGDGDEEDVKGVEGLVEVVMEKTEGGYHRDGEGGKHLRR